MGRSDARCVPGRHNLQNALAAVAVGSSWACRSTDRRRPADFRGAERRFEVRGEPNGILVVDDYGHHPTEIAAVLAAARRSSRRIVVAFQPHRFTRTAALMDAFGPALGGADHIVLTDIYAAGEDRFRRDARRAGAAVRAACARRSTSCRARRRRAGVVRGAQPGDVVITLGAGRSARCPIALIEALASA
jgi:UDP-N-acetylmuramate--alanine ligase